MIEASQELDQVKPVLLIYHWANAKISIRYRAHCRPCQGRYNSVKSYLTQLILWTLRRRGRELGLRLVGVAGGWRKVQCGHFKCPFLFKKDKERWMFSSKKSTSRTPNFSSNHWWLQQISIWLIITSITPKAQFSPNYILNIETFSAWKLSLYMIKIYNNLATLLLCRN